jgi:hypothetical protein
VIVSDSDLPEQTRCFWCPISMRVSSNSNQLLIASLLVFSTFPLIAQEIFFPKNALDDSSWNYQFKAKWYSQELEVLKEPSLLALSRNPSSESYRFLWLRTFNHPVAVRLDIREDGIGVITTKVASGTAGFRPGQLSENMSRPLMREQTQAFLKRLGKVGFWSLPNPINDQTGTDGSQWIIEGVKKGNYHVVDRWSPAQGAIWELGLYLAVGLALMNVPKDEIY